MHTYIYARSWNGDSGDADIYIAADQELLSGEEKDFSDVCNSDCYIDELERAILKTSKSALIVP
jgi:hypothetical protein